MTRGQLVVGLDEVGRGCWAGPLVAGAVILSAPIPGLADSKQLSRRQRDHLDGLIRDQSVIFGLGWVEPREIETLGLTASVRLAFTRALSHITCDFDTLIIDGNINFFPADRRARAIVRADATIAAVSAASILAKVARDRYMIAMSHQYPQYGFEKHVGYGTAFHQQALRIHGICDLHRRNYKPVMRALSSEKGLNAR